MKKTISFAAVHFSVAFSLTYAMTGDLVIGGAVALIEPAVNTVAFYFHEKIWSLKATPSQVVDQGSGFHA